MKHATNRQGLASILALVFLAMFAALAIAYAAATNMNLTQADNLGHVQIARLQAESGLSFCTYVLKNTRLARGLTGQAMLDALATAMGTQLNGTPNLNGQTVAYNGTSITLPVIATDARGRRFQAVLTRGSDTVVHVRVTGQDGSVTRAVGMNYNLTQKRSAAFDYGVAARGPVRLTGNARIRGQNNAVESNILSGTYSTPEAFQLTGNCEIQGDLFASSPDAYATLVGNVKVGGVTGGAGHIHLGIGDVEFPEVDPAVFEPFATNVLSGGTSGNKTFTNLRIPANTNPTFSGNITFKGVVFIEKPNKVHFSGNTTLKAVIVTQDAGDGVYEANTIKFSGNVAVTGVETLPDTPEFHQLRQMPGSFLLAPGFGTEFTGNFGTVSGCMASECFQFTGNAGGTVNGPVISYSDAEFKLVGNSALVINRQNSPDTPAGFASSSRPLPDRSSYVEY